MSAVEFNHEQKSMLLNKLKTYCSDELGFELGQFDAEFLLDFIAREMGNHFYNQGLRDAQVVMQSRVDAIMESIDEIEKPV